MYTDCIHFQETYEEIPKYRCCTRSGSLYRKGDEDDIMCQHCRLWDAYIPKSATDAEKEKALMWDNMSLDEQLENPYENYFGL